MLTGTPRFRIATENLAFLVDDKHVIVEMPAVLTNRPQQHRNAPPPLRDTARGPRPREPGPYPVSWNVYRADSH